MAELLWANLHGLTLLQNAGRIRKDGGQRVTALVQLIAG
jgi:hypothetical protein